jgi:apolipoprotein N-acyltransferase
MAGVALGQVSGPMAPVARLGGELAVVGVTVALGVALAAAWQRRFVPAAVASGVVAALVVIGVVAPDGGDGPTIDAALVQGGGRRGFRAVNTDPAEVFRAHVAASANLPAGLDLVLWPEDVIDVDRPIDETPEAEQVGAIASRVGAPLIAGVVEDYGEDQFRNASVLWERDGRIADRYDKVHRVPFGEYIPGRALIDKIADLSVIPRDAVAGSGPGVLHTSSGTVGVVISYEVYFADRARAAANAGGRLLLVPTNAASFKTSQVPTTQVAASRLRAIETGRDTMQAGPTGYGAVIDHRGRLLARTVLGRRQIIEHSVTLRSGRTVYNRFGDGGTVIPALLLLGGAWLLERRRDGSW